jgi:hypothetical protein
MTFSGEILAELSIVFDDSVVDDGQAGPTVDVGVRIGVRGTPVGRPARVGNTYRPLGRIFFEQGFEPDDLPHGFAHVKGFPVDGRYAGRIVSPIFETSEGRQEDGCGLSRPDIANDATHLYALLLK